VVPLYADDRPDNVAYMLNDSGASRDPRSRVRSSSRSYARSPSACRTCSASVSIRPIDDPARSTRGALSQLDFCRRGGRYRSRRRRPTASSSRPRLHLGHHRQAQGRNALAPKHAAGREGRALGLQGPTRTTSSSRSCRSRTCSSARPATTSRWRRARRWRSRVRCAALRGLQDRAPDGDGLGAAHLRALHGALQGTLASASPTKKRLFEVDATASAGISSEWHQSRGVEARRSRCGRLLDRWSRRSCSSAFGGRLRLCISGGAALNPQIAHTFIGLGLPICQGYGLTEASPGREREPAGEERSGEHRTCRCPGVEVAFGENSALKVRGPTVMMGYWQQHRKRRPRGAEPSRLARHRRPGAQKTASSTSPAASRTSSCSATARKVPPVDMELAAQLDPSSSR
jgi:hypothetical protein